MTDAPDSCFQYDTNNRLVVFNGNSVSYDLDGNMLNDGVCSYTYDSANRLKSFGGHTYTYTSADIRIRNLCADEDTTYTYNTNCKLSQLLTKTTNGFVTKYVYGLGLIGEEKQGCDFKTYHFDFRGSTVAITDVEGNITDTFAYDTYGNLVSRTGTSKVIFLYNGRDGVITDDNGLYYMRARYYSPEMRRFVNADIVAGQISNAVTLNRFAYANGNPVSFVDPFGLWSLKGAWNSFTNWVEEKIVDPVVDTAVTVGNAIADTAVTVGTAIADTAQTVSKWVDDNVVKPTGKALENAGRQIKDGFQTVANAISDNVGAKVSAGKEETLDKEYYYFATVENGIGYSKDFGDEKPVNFFASAGENWWEFWKWSVGIDVNINGYGAGISLGTETSINVHTGNVSHEVGANALGRISHKVAYNVGDGYAYSKYSLNGPETALAVVGVAALIYYAPALIPAIGAGVPALAGVIG